MKQILGQRATGRGEETGYTAPKVSLVSHLRPRKQPREPAGRSSPCHPRPAIFLLIAELGIRVRHTGLGEARRELEVIEGMERQILAGELDDAPTDQLLELLLKAYAALRRAYGLPAAGEKREAAEEILLP